MSLLNEAYSTTAFGDVQPMDVTSSNPNVVIETKQLDSDKNLTPLASISKQLKSDIMDFEQEDWDEINMEIKEKGNHQNKKEFDFNSEAKNIFLLKQKLTTTVEKYQKLEMKIKCDFNKSKKLEKKIIDFTEFITDFENNNKERNCQTFKDALYEFVILYNDDNNLRQTISDYVDTREELTQMLAVSRMVQSFQTVPTCPLCLSQPLDSFMEPCGHTGCKTCLIRSIQGENNHNEMNLNCVYCRKEIHSIKPLFLL